MLCLVGIVSLAIQHPARAALFEQATGDLQAEARAAAAEGKRLAVFLTLPDCTGCQEMDRTVFGEKPVERRFSRRFRSVRVDIAQGGTLLDPTGNQTTAGDFAKKIHAFATPSLAFFDGGGTMLYRHTGTLDAAGLSELGNFVANGSYEFKPFVPHRARHEQNAFFADPMANTLARQPDFVLDGSDGRRHRLSDFRGVTVALAVGYTLCPDVCPTTLTELQSAVSSLPGKQRQQVQVLFATLDPERDSLAILKAYVAAFNPPGGRPIIGLQGNPSETADLIRELRLVAEKQPSASMGYTLDHTAGVFLFDARGRLVGLSPYGQAFAKLRSDLAKLAGQTPHLLANR